MNRAEIITLKCARDGRFVGLRVEEMSSRQWVVTWSFPMDAINEYSGIPSSVAGDFTITPGVDACPRCGAHGLVKCGSCDKATCFAGNDGDLVTCGWCEAQANVGGTIDSLDASGDA